MPGLGTIVNVAAILAGTSVGLVVGHRIPERTRRTVLQALGLVTLALGAQGVLGTRNIVFPTVAVVIGTVLGELASLEDRLEGVGERLRRRFGRDESTFVEGFVAASVLFGVGPLAILGSIADGLDGDLELLVVKSALDGMVSVIFAATLGWGVGFSVLPVAAYQGALTLLAGMADRLLTDRMVTEMTAAGGVMVMAIAIRLLEIKHVRVASMLPGLAIAPLLVAAFAR